jgi:Tfp pilus assembly protein PilF
MSLLLEALKKAERAKEEAQRRARGESAGGELRLDMSDAEGEPPANDARPVTTRAELPDIKQPLEILSDDIAAKEPQPAPAPQRPPLQIETPKAPKAADAERASAKKVFEAKFKEPNPRLPFLITMGFLGVFAVGTVGYFWYQLRPPPSLVNRNPVPAPAVETAAITAPVPAAAAATPAPAAPVIQGLPRTAVALAPKPAPIATPVPVAARPAAPRPVATSAVQPAAPARPIVQESPPAAPRVHPRVDAGYAAYLSGDLPTARAAYQDALREDGSNRDALLGLAAIDVRSGRLENAEATYLRLLQVDPNDAHAQAGLIALRSARLDPLATESRLKTMLAADPGANVLHFALGNQLAQQGRWAEAQQEYFKAFAANPDNPDLAFNLAVSLDHLRQRKLALEYYRRAIALAEKRGSTFDQAAARTRATQLEAP